MSPRVAVDAAPVVVVGAGPTGLTAAALLAGEGVRTVVLERYAEPYPLPRAVHVDDEVRRVLQQIGLDERFAAVSRPASGLRLLDARHRVMAEFARGDGALGHPRSNLFDQPDLEDLLRRRVVELGLVDLRPGCDVVRLAGAAQDEVVYRDAAGEHRLRASAVLGCDGANSLVRGQIGARLRDLRFEERWFVVDARCEGPVRGWDGVEQVCDPRRAATFMRIADRRYRWEFRMLPGESVEHLVARLPDLVRPWVCDPQGLQVVRAAEYTFRARVADRWRRGRVFVLGDAAHQTPPFIGQGLGSGLRDAHNLAWKLARVLAGDAGERLLDTYEQERRPVATQVIRSAVLAGWAMTGGQDAAAAVRRAALAGLLALPGGVAVADAASSPRLPRGPLVRSGRSWGDPAGRPCPQPWVVRDGVRLRLDSLLGNGFAIVTDGPADPSLAALLGPREPVATVDVSPHASDGVHSPELRDWLRRAGASSVLVRPDRTVMARGRAPTARSTGRRSRPAGSAAAAG